VGPLGRRIQEAGISVHALGLRRRRLALGPLAALARLLASEQPIVLQTWLYHADFLGLLNAQIARVPHVVWNLRDSDRLVVSSPSTTLWTAKVCSRLSRWPSAVIANTEAGRRFHASLGYRPRRWAVIPNGF